MIKTLSFYSLVNVMRNFQNPNVFVEGQNADSLMFKKHKSKPGDSISMSAHRFTQSIETIVTPATVQQQKETQ